MSKTKSSERIISVKQAERVLERSRSSIYDVARKHNFGEKDENGIMHFSEFELSEMKKLRRALKNA